MNQFFLVCPIGLENLVKRELELKYPELLESKEMEILQLDKGGIELQTDLSKGLNLNRSLKTVSKILLRIKTQKCRDYPKLFNIIRKINWKDYYKQTDISFSCTTSESRIIHTGRVEESCLKGIEAYFKANKIPEKQLKISENYPTQTVYIRIHQDTMTISLDTSGKLMHIREDRSFRGHASIRENIASLLLLRLIQGLKTQEDEYTLIDPMCGTGTFLFEAARFYNLSNREYLYQYMNVESEKNLEYAQKMPFNKFIGADIDSEIIKKNIELNSNIQFIQNDLFKDIPANKSSKNVLIINPPYGKRVKIEGDKVQFFKDLINRVKEVYKPVIFGILIPRDFASSIKASERLAFSQNGIKVEFLIFK